VTAGTRSASAASAAAYRPAGAALRLAWLHVISRRVPLALGLLAAFGVLFGVALRYRWSMAGGPAVQVLVPLAIRTGAAAVIAVSTHGPFGDSDGLPPGHRGRAGREPDHALGLGSPPAA
jgi:hypothetical protein